MSSGGSPAHKRGDGTDHCASPGVPNSSSFHPRVRSSIQGDVGQSKGGGGGVGHGVKQDGAESSGNDRKGGSMEGTNGLPNQRSRSCADHLGIERNLLELV